jgi:RimJ/RimL family protein N-acetyltransferase
MIGYVSLKPIRQADAAELGICFSADYVHQGYGTEALKLVLPWAVGVLNLDRIVLEVDAVNSCAVKLYQRRGFHHVGESWYREVNPKLKRYLDQHGPLDGVRILKKQVELLSWKMEWTADNLSAR